MLLSGPFSDQHLRCGGWINFEFIKRGKHLGWAIKTIYKKQRRGMLKRIPLDQGQNKSLKLLRGLSEVSGVLVY